MIDRTAPDHMARRVCIECMRPADATYRGLPDPVSQGMHESCYARRYGLDPIASIRDAIERRQPAPHVLTKAEQGR